MGQRLIIVESPAKARSMHKHLGEEYTALASYGHILELAPGKDAVDPDNNFAMHYTPIPRKQSHTRAILRAAEQADTIYLASDPDREGEAIAWDLHELLKAKGLLTNKSVYRVIFHEITGPAIRHAIAHPRELLADLVDAQHARRALDYLVGFHLSPLLWKKIHHGLSVGRVQSPALRMIIEREAEIEVFTPREYWSIQAQLQSAGEAGGSFTASLSHINGEKLSKFSIPDESQAQQTLTQLQDTTKEALYVRKLDKQQIHREPAPPFITASLQQAAARELGFSPMRTMRVAQRLFEGPAGTGLITYMRTDSVSLSNAAIAQIRETITQKFGDDQMPQNHRHFQNNSKNAQEAHEAIRPTAMQRTPESLSIELEHDALQLYTLIWQRSLASQMNEARIEATTAQISAGDTAYFKLSGSSLVDPGFLAAFAAGAGQNPEDALPEKTLPPLEIGDQLKLHSFNRLAHTTTAPDRYSEASLIGMLESHSIGRPSSYASIISTLLNQEYVTLEQKRFYPSDMGRIVGEFLIQHFQAHVDYSFTAKMEADLDAIAHGTQQWKPLLSSFWEAFSRQLTDKQSLPRSEVLKPTKLGVDPASGKPVSVRMGQFGPFVQIGSHSDPEKPAFASLLPRQTISHISLKEALDLFILPRRLGKTSNGETINAGIGRFGAYLHYGDTFISLSSRDDPYRIELKRALELIKQKQQFDDRRYIKTFEKQHIQVIKGQYGPYISDGKINARIPAKQLPETLTLAQCRQLLVQAADRKRQRKKGPGCPS